MIQHFYDVCGRRVNRDGEHTFYTDIRGVRIAVRAFPDASGATADLCDNCWSSVLTSAAEPPPTEPQPEEG